MSIQLINELQQGRPTPLAKRIINRLVQLEQLLSNQANNIGYLEQYITEDQDLADKHRKTIKELENELASIRKSGQQTSEIRNRDGQPSGSYSYCAGAPGPEVYESSISFALK